MTHREKLAHNALFSRVAKEEQLILNASLLLSIFINLWITFSGAFKTSYWAFFGLIFLGLLQIAGAVQILYVNVMSDGQLELRKRWKERGVSYKSIIVFNNEFMPPNLEIINYLNIYLKCMVMLGKLIKNTITFMTLIRTI